MRKWYQLYTQLLKITIYIQLFVIPWSSLMHAHMECVPLETVLGGVPCYMLFVVIFLLFLNVSADYLNSVLAC